MDLSLRNLDLATHFDQILGQSQPLGCSEEEIRALDLRLEPADAESKDRAFIFAIQYLLKDYEPSGPDYLQRWESGWGENKEAFSISESIEDLVPAYISKNKLFRFNGSFFSSPNPMFEIDFARVLVTHFVEKYLKDCEEIFDLGSGSCHYTYWLAKKFPEREYLALDWSLESNEIAKQLSTMGLPVQGHRFDMFEPNAFQTDSHRRGLLTVGALEQLGSNFDPILAWMEEMKFETIVNIEPIYELYNQALLFDFLPAQYLKKRNWLIGFLPKIEDLAATGKVQILEKRRIFGSQYHETYNAIVWRFK